MKILFFYSLKLFTKLSLCLKIQSETELKELYYSKILFFLWAMGDINPVLQFILTSCMMKNYVST